MTAVGTAETQNEVRFYRSTGRFGALSNLYPFPMWFEGTFFLSSEHAYQYGKPNKPELAEWIRRAPYPRLAAIAGHGLFPYDIVENWNEIKIDRMRRVLAAKFEEHEMWEVLKATRGKTIIEDSKTDAFWGLGAKGKGKNMLGQLLMEIRDKRETDVLLA